MAFQREQIDMGYMFSLNKETRRVKVPAGLELNRGEAVEITTVGSGTALDQVGKLTVANKLEGYILNRVDTTNGVACEADVVYVADWVSRENVLHDGAISIADLVTESRKLGLPLVDNIEEQGVTN